MLDSLRRTIVEVKAAKGIQDISDCKKLVGYHYIILSPMYLIQVFQFTCCSNLVAFKFQVNKKTQNHISVYLQECGFESFCILLFEQQYRYMNVHLLIHILPIFRYCEQFNFVVPLHPKK